MAAPVLLSEDLEWIQLNSLGNISAGGLLRDRLTFLNGDYDYGFLLDLDRLKQISSSWELISEYYASQGRVLEVFGDINKVGYSQNLRSNTGMVLNDQNINETYYGLYVRPEVNFGKKLMFMPGLRYERMSTSMEGFYAQPPVFPPSIDSPVAGFVQEGENKNSFFLPMVHLRYKPTKFFYTHFSWTNALSRPQFNAMSPNTFVNTGWPPISYSAGNPDLRPEQWSSFDAQFALHGLNIGLFAITLFSKRADDKIWNRSFRRIAGDDIIEPFGPSDQVIVSVWENHPFDIELNGVEVEFQHSFHYLNGIFQNFTIYTNYTYTSSNTFYPYSSLKDIVNPDTGRPVRIRIDSTVQDVMLQQPKHILNFSLGYNKGGLNVWSSFQYNGGILISKDYNGVPGNDRLKDNFYRLDLQITQKIKIGNFQGVDLIFNCSNINDFQETQRLRGHNESTFIEKYGWTIDLGIRATFK